MSLIVENGEGLADAESYASVAECAAYASSFANAGWTGTDAAKESALRKATQYLDSAYAWKSSPLQPFTQALQWPRIDYLWAWPETKLLKKACCELAIRSLTGDLFTDTASQHVTSATVGPIKRDLSAPANNGQKRYAIVDAMVRTMVLGGSGSSAIGIIRA